MKSKKIFGTKDLEGLRFRLKSVGDKLKASIDSDSKRTDELVREYKRIQELIKEGEEEIAVAKRQEEEKRRIKEEKEAAEEKQLIKDAMEDKDKRIKAAEERKSKIDEQLGELYYKKETLLHQLNFLKEERADQEEAMDKAKEIGNVPEMINAREILKLNKASEQEIDEKLSAVTSRIAIAEKRKTKINEKIIDEITEIIIDYNGKADEYGLQKIDLARAIRERLPQEEMKVIRGEQQSRYRIESEYLVGELKEEERANLEEESNLRLKERKENSLTIKMAKGTKKVLNAIAGTPAFVGKTIARVAKKIWKTIGNKVNEGMIKNTEGLIKILERDADTYQKRKEKFSRSIKSNINEQDAIDIAAEQDNENVKEDENRSAVQNYLLKCFRKDGNKYMDKKKIVGYWGYIPANLAKKGVNFIEEQMEKKQQRIYEIDEQTAKDKDAIDELATKTDKASQKEWNSRYGKVIKETDKLEKSYKTLDKVRVAGEK